jgi:SAM-dependent methyltransferase
MNCKTHFDWVAENDSLPRQKQAAFHQYVLQKLRHHIKPGARVLEWGCGRGSLLKGLEPSRGLGIDLSPKMIEQAKARNAADHLEFLEGDLHAQVIDEKFDAVVLDFLSGYLTDLQQCFENVRASCHPRTRIYLTSLNQLWKPFFGVAQKLGLVMPQPASNWRSTADLVDLLQLTGFEVVKSSTEQLFPFKLPIVSGFFNRFLVRLPGFRYLGASLFTSDEASS